MNQAQDHTCEDQRDVGVVTLVHPHMNSFTGTYDDNCWELSLEP